MKDSLNIAIAGATGYVGIELIKILLKHSKVKILYLCANKSAGKKISYFDKKLSSKKLPKISKIQSINWKNLDIIFTALPDGEAQKISKKKPNHVKLIDLSADFRLKDPKVYKKWYGKKFINKKVINKSLYAISEFSRKSLQKYNIISCPGCYPTSIQIPLIPILQKNMINPNNIIIDSKSGYSGAGKSIKKKFNFTNIYQSVNAYKIGFHRHMAEIDQELSKVSKSKIEVSFTPHLIPVFRGILSTIYLETKNNISAKSVYTFLKNFHKNNFFVKVAKYNTPIGTGDVMNTNYCQISVCNTRKKKSNYNSFCDR